MTTVQIAPRTLSERILQPFQRFFQIEASGGVLLLICAATALAWANSPWAASYTSIWQMKLTVGLGSFVLSKSLLLWINDGLMAVFFFVVGLEIKREVLAGELASLKRAALPIAAALGGMLAPALFYTAFNAGRPGAAGWGIPMATDIAFALGMLALLGNRVPVSLKVFLTALAIVDDIGAVLVIAVFYSTDIAWLSLLVAAGFLILLIALNVAGVRHPLPYALIGIGLWVAFLKSGVHATIAGVLLAMTIPSRARINEPEFLANGRSLLDEFERATGNEIDRLITEEQLAVVEALETVCEQIETPLQRLEHALHGWVMYAIMPIFALANAGVALGEDLLAALTHLVTFGVIAGLLFGKTLGISVFTWLAVRSGVAALPEGVGWRQIVGAGMLGGIGFTMSLFIADLAFVDTPLLTPAKLGIMIASLIAGVAGWLVLRNTGGAAAKA